MTGKLEQVGSIDPMQSIRIDPHLHTSASYDGHTTPRELLERAEDIGLDAIVVTDHDTVAGARRVVELAPGYDLIAISGCEVSTADGHLLAVGVETAPEPGNPLPETARRIRDAGGLAIVPHPFQRSRHGARKAVIEGVDGLEVYNGHTLTSYRNTQAARFASREGYRPFGGSDAHRPGEIGRAATLLRVPASATVTTERLLTALRDGYTAAVGHRSSTWQYLTKIVENLTRKTLSISTPMLRS